jgi:uncharacterized membrane protein YphA (DoxX/SURF4 family)
MNVGVRILMAIIYFLAGFAIFFGRKRLVESKKSSIMVIPAALLILAAITTLLK